MAWEEHQLTAEQRAANWMWLAATSYPGDKSDFVGEGIPPSYSDDGPFPGTQWFDSTTGRAWVWRGEW